MSIKQFWRYSVTAISLISTPSFAESTRFVHWWNDYFPLKDEKAMYSYRGKIANSLQYQDVNHDGIYNDALLWYEFSLTNPLNPLDSEYRLHRYRLNRPSARFYGGMVARFTNVSHLMTTNLKGERVPFFNHFQQSTVQPTEGARPCTYSANYPHHTGRSWESISSEMSWADITIMVVNSGGSCCPMSDKFHKTKNAETNFTAALLWKKADFINGGATVAKITFDQTSKLSIDVTRFRENVEEGRFLIQDGEQLWISEAAIIPNAEGHFADGVNGMETTDFKYGVEVQLNPLNSRWAPYNPTVPEDELAQLAKTIADGAFNPKKASAETQQLHHNNSDQLLAQIDQIVFDAKTATFGEHQFENVQAVGVYFATYQFAHKTTQLVMDNFQLYAAGEVPKTKAVAINSQGLLVDTTTTFGGGISRNSEAFERRVTQCVPDQVTIHSQIAVDPADVNKSADILALAIYQTTPEDGMMQIYQLGDEGKQVTEWDGQLANLLAFQANVILAPEQLITILQGKLTTPGFIRFMTGYRLQNGTIVFNPQSFDTHINVENIHPRFEVPSYSEALAQDLFNHKPSADDAEDENEEPKTDTVNESELVDEADDGEADSTIDESETTVDELNLTDAELKVADD
jgi:hypothetical protein